MRGLSRPFIDDLKNGMLMNVLANVKEDDTLCLEIRENYINIYYRGGNILKIEPNNGGYKVHFALEYCSKYRNVLSQIPSHNIDLWLNNIPFLKAEMDLYFHKHPKLEREYQQIVARENNSGQIANETDYFIIDLEYSNSVNHSRFDMLGMKWISTAGSHKRADDIRLVFIEKKYGDNALSGSAGIQKHFKDIYNFLSNPLNVDNLYEEAETLIRQKIELGLLYAHKKEIKLVRDRPELMLLLANHKPQKTVLHRELNAVINSPDYSALNQLVDIKIAKASYMGYGLYDELMVDIETFLKC